MKNSQAKLLNKNESVLKTVMLNSPFAQFEMLLKIIKQCLQRIFCSKPLINIELLFK